VTAAIFGFGSLVSRASIDAPVIGLEPSRIFGHRRAWCQPFSVGGLSYASLGLAPGNVTDFVDGVTLTVPLEAMAYFESREAGYRHVSVEALHKDGRVQPAVSFESRETASKDAFIPLSYLATVVVGFWELYGREQGLELFMENTGGWERPVMFDVEQPVYPRRPDNLRQVAADLRPALERMTRVVDPAPPLTDELSR